MSENKIDSKENMERMGRIFDKHFPSKDSPKDFEEKKICRYCRKVVKKLYTSETNCIMCEDCLCR